MGSHAVRSRHLFQFFLLGMPDKCTRNLVSSLLVYLIHRSLCILDPGVFTYYSSKLSMKKAVFSSSPKGTS